jgi:CDP-diacylglycerol--serine O-phosphatidyltransferase
LMVSNIRYHSFKEFDLKNRIPFVTFLIIVPVFFLIAVETALVLFLLAMIYAVSGPVMTLILLRKHRVARKDAR